MSPMKRLLLVALVSASASAQNRNIVFPPRQNNAVSIGGSITANQGTPAALANPWPIEITMDGLFVYGVLAHPFRVDPTGVTTQPVSLVSVPLPTGAALDATLTGGNEKAIVRGGAKGSTTASDVTSTSTDSNHNALDVNVNNTPTVTANAGTNLNTSALALDATLTGGTATTRVTDGTNTATVKAASTAASATDKALVVAVSPNNTIAATQSGTWTVQPGNTANSTAWKVDGSAVTQPANLSQVGGNSVVTGGTNGSQGVGGLAATNSTAAGNPVLVGGSDYGGTPKAQNVKVDSSGFLHATLEASTGTSNVSATQSGNWTSRTVGNAGAQLDFAGQNASAPANSFLVGGEFNTTPTTITNGNASPLQLDSAGDLLVKVNAALPTGSNTIGAVTQASGPWSSNVTQFGGSNISTGTGAGGSGVPRVTISNDSSLAANQSVNLAQVAGTNTVNGGLAGSQSIGGTAATNASINQNPVLIGVEANSGQPAAATTGNQRQLLGSLDGAIYTRLGGPVLWSCGIAAQAASLAQCQATPGAGLSLYVTSIIVGGNTSTAGQWTITSGTGTNCGTTNVALLAGSTAVKFFSPTSAQPVAFLPFPSPIKLPANTELCALGVATNTTNIQVTGFTAP